MLLKRSSATRPRLFGKNLLKVYTDGASRGNPGLSGAGILITDQEGNVIKQHSEFLGVMTNNSAEYSALLKSLDVIGSIDKELVNGRTEFYSDSELMVRQINGRYKVKDRGISEFVRAFRDKVKSMKLEFVINHIPRSANSAADKLANEAIDKREVQQTMEFE